MMYANHYLEYAVQNGWRRMRYVYESNRCSHCFEYLLSTYDESGWVSVSDGDASVLCTDCLVTGIRQDVMFIEELPI